jgi:hypothetical protein
MPQVAAAAALVGAGIQVYGAITSANDQNALDQEKASVARQQAAEIEARNQSNAALLDQTAMRQKLQFGASYAASGKAGTGVGSQLQIQNQADLQNMIATREAKFQESMLQQQAGIDTTMGDQLMKALPWQVAGDIAGGLGSAARLGTTGSKNPGDTGTQGSGLGAYPTVPSSDNYTMPALGAGRFGGG